MDTRTITHIATQLVSTCKNQSGGLGSVLEESRVHRPGPPIKASVRVASTSCQELKGDSAEARRANKDTWRVM